MITQLLKKFGLKASGIRILESDGYDRAYKWAWEEAGMQELVRLCYKTPDFPDNARRFASSEEFQAVIKELADLGVTPGPGKAALDFGCGNGVASYALGKAGFDVTAVDSSAGLLAGLGAARQLDGLDGVELNFREHTGELLDFPDSAFDLVYIREVLHHIGNLSGFLAQVRRILKPGGVICCLRDVVIWNEAQRDHFFAHHPLYPITQDEGCYYLDEYLTAFVESGLHLQRVVSPSGSVINVYPLPFESPQPYDFAAARVRQSGYDLFSFFATKVERIVSS
jgi:SAM-dependent methyltransferase